MTLNLLKYLHYNGVTLNHNVHYFLNNFSRRYMTIIFSSLWRTTFLLLQITQHKKEQNNYVGTLSSNKRKQEFSTTLKVSSSYSMQGINQILSRVKKWTSKMILCYLENYPYHTQYQYIFTIVNQISNSTMPYLLVIKIE